MAFEYLPDVGVVYRVETAYSPQVESVQFGDGYRQDNPRGINNIQEKYTVSWENLPEDKAESLLQHFRHHRGTGRFYFFPKGRTHPPVKVVCTDWSDSMPYVRGSNTKKSAGLVDKVSATFIKVFEV